MKAIRTKLLMIVILSLSIKAQAQLGLKVGVYTTRGYNERSITDSSTVSFGAASKVQYQVGIFYYKKISSRWGIQPEVTYYGSQLDHTYTVGIPLLATYNMTERLKVVAGSQLFLSSENPKYHLETKRTMKPTYAFPIGIQYKLGSGLVSARYITGSFSKFEISIGFDITKSRD